MQIAAMLATGARGRHRMSIRPACQDEPCCRLTRGRADDIGSASSFAALAVRTRWAGGIVMRLVLPVSLVLVVLTATGSWAGQSPVAGSQSVQGRAAKAVTFTKDVAPILQNRCQTCHRPGTVAPMSLLT